MPRQSNGVYELLPGVYGTPGDPILSTPYNSQLDDFATALTKSISSDGLTPVTANLRMDGFRHTNVGNASARTMYAATGQVQDGSFAWCGSSGGTADALTLTPSPAIAAVAAGQVFRFIATETNTGAATVAISGLTAIDIEMNGAALAAGAIQDGLVHEVLVVDSSTCELRGVASVTGPGTVLDGAMAVFDGTSGRALRAGPVNATEGEAGPAELATDAEALAGTDDTRIATVAKIGGWLGRAMVPGGRLSLTSATPVTTSDVTAATSIYYALYEHNLIQFWDGTRWRVSAFAELELELDSDGGHTGYHQAGKNFDLFAYLDGSTLRLGSGPAWTNDTTRAAAIARKDGRWTNNASMLLRYGSANGDTVTAAANTALYLGTFRATADGQTEDSRAKRFVWNAYNRVVRVMRNATETTDTWAYATATWRQANANAANQLDFVRGLDEDAVIATAQGVCRNSNTNITFTGIGLDSTSAIAADSNPGVATGNTTATNYSMVSTYRGLPGIGRHYLAWLEYANAAAVTATWTGDGGDATLYQTGISGEMMG